MARDFCLEACVGQAVGPDCAKVSAWTLTNEGFQNVHQTSQASAKCWEWGAAYKAALPRRFLGSISSIFAVPGEWSPHGPLHTFSVWVTCRLKSPVFVENGVSEWICRALRTRHCSSIILLPPSFLDLQKNGGYRRKSSLGRVRNPSAQNRQYPLEESQSCCSCPHFVLLFSFASL